MENAGAVVVTVQHFVQLEPGGTATAFLSTTDGSATGKAKTVCR